MIASDDWGRIEAITLDSSADYPDLGQIRAYWDRRRGDRFAPRRADIDPADLKEFLSRIMIADVLRDPMEFRYRLSGTNIGSVHGQEMTGKRPRDLTPAAYGELIHAHYCEAVERRQPLLHLILLDTSQRSRSYARLLLPLSEDGETVSMLLTIDSREQNSKALRDFFAKTLPLVQAS